LPGGATVRVFVGGIDHRLAIFNEMAIYTSRLDTEIGAGNYRRSPG
jgi:hypothetical protein